MDTKEDLEDLEGVKKDKHESRKKSNKEIDDLLKKNDELLKNITELEDRLKLSQAEMINFRRRKEEETSNMLKYANMDFANELLPIVDNFERAIDIKEDLGEEAKKYLDGFKIIYGGLSDIFKKFEVREIDCLNKPFDPNYHQALMTEKVESVEAGTIVEVLQKGYMIKDKLLRPALVKVSD